MNAVEIEEAVSRLAEAPFDGQTFPYAFLEAFGNKETTLKRLKSGNTNQSDIGGVLQRGNIHIKTCPAGQVSETLAALRHSPLTARQKAKFILATDGQTLEAENLADDLPPLVCAYQDLPNHFAFFLPLAGITTVRQISENAFDIRATGRLNRLYVELLRHNPDWDTDARREDLNHFFARLIFCFFAEDTGIFVSGRLFTSTIEQMTARDGSDTHQVLSELFRAMNTRQDERQQANIRPWATSFPYVNGNLFSGSTETPRFSQIARSYLIFVGGLDWKQINPDIFGSMIQAVADDEERGALGMHYTSVPNILKVLNPLFLDDLRQQLADATDDDQAPTPRFRLGLPPDSPRLGLGLPLDDPRLRVGLPSANPPPENPPRKQGPPESNPQRKQGPSQENPPRKQAPETENPQRKQAPSRKLLNLRNRLARIRVFDPACGSGNFLVIAYKEMRAIEAEINRRRGEPDRPSDIPPTNFRGIEIRNFAAEIARLALIIAKFQCDSIYRGELLARAEFLPLEKANWITCGNALRLDWLKICPPTGTGVKISSDDLFSTPLDQTEIDFENEGGETYICGNPPYKGSTYQNKEQKGEIRDVVGGRTNAPGFLDYVSGWFIKAADWLDRSPGRAAFVTTNSICQGQMVPLLWPIIRNTGCEIPFAHTSFKWSNLASHNAGVTVAIVCISRTSNDQKALYELDVDGQTSVRFGSAITPYLTLGGFVIVKKTPKPVSEIAIMEFGNKPSDGGHLLIEHDQLSKLSLTKPQRERFTRRIFGSADFINGGARHCVWIEDEHLAEAQTLPCLAERINAVREVRLASPIKVPML